ncbi:MAG TPA: hypothetical protein VNM14_10615 [Planctomycetota bacterium]|jgi:hypothetical protein|nr:hypothetical protein [Planctomycetota bacterium]
MAASFSPLPRHLVASFRLWHYPNAGPQSSWAVFHGRVDDPMAGAPRVRRLVWDRDADLERLALGTRRRPQLEPTLTRVETEIDGHLLSAFMRSAGRLSMPRHRLTRPYVSGQPPEFGLEGFDLEGRDGRPVVRMEWERNPPLQMEGVAGWADQVRDWLRRSLP